MAEIYSERCLSISCSSHTLNDFKAVSQKCDNITSRRVWGHASPPASLFILLTEGEILQEPVGLMPLRQTHGPVQWGLNSGNLRITEVNANQEGTTIPLGCQPVFHQALPLQDANLLLEKKIWTEVKGDNRETGGADLAVVVITQSIVTPDCKITSYHIYNTLLCSGFNVMGDAHIKNNCFYSKNKFKIRLKYL